MASGPDYRREDRIIGFIAWYAAACLFLMMTLGVVTVFKMTWENW